MGLGNLDTARTHVLHKRIERFTLDVAANYVAFDDTTIDRTPAAYPGTELDRVARENNWIIENKDIRTMVAGDGVQVSSISYPHLSHKEIFDAVAEMYKRFYIRPSKIAEIVGEMLMSWDMLRRRLREGVEFMHFLRTREDRV